MRTPECHPDRKFYGKELCKPCYMHLYNIGRLKPVERSRGIKTRDKRKFEVLSHYSPDGILGCCWEGCTITDIDMLSLDHVNDDGAEHRRSIKSKNTTSYIYRWVRANGYPEGFQTLCMNHQFKKKILKARLSRMSG